MKFFALFIYRPVATILISLAITLCGVLGFRLLPVAPLPQVDFPVIMVSASLPGASPETMASSVATPLERSLGRIAGVNEMTSSSSLGSTRIILEFKFDRDINGAARDVQAAINAAQSLLPSGMPSRPTYRKANPSDAPIMILTLTSDTYSQGELYDFASTQLAQTIALITLLEGREGEEEPDVVRLSTVHASKGLEFPYVYMVGMEEGLLPHQTSIDEDNVEEERRLAYVGITRAQTELTFTLCKERRQYGESVRPEPSRFLLELPQDDLEWENQKKVTAEERQQKGQVGVANLRALFKKD